MSRLENLGIIWDPRSMAWEEGFRYFERYISEHGDAKVPAGYKIDGYNLGKWVGRQRHLKDQLTSEGMSRLESLGIVWDPLSQAWEEGYRHLEQYIAAHGHLRVPRGYKIDGYNLGNWVSKQRTKKDQLTPERRTRLETLAGWVWSVK